jgi:hypothetical protein
MKHNVLQLQEKRNNISTCRTQKCQHLQNNNIKQDKNICKIASIFENNQNIVQ